MPRPICRLGPRWPAIQAMFLTSDRPADQHEQKLLVLGVQCQQGGGHLQRSAGGHLRYRVGPGHRWEHGRRETGEHRRNRWPRVLSAHGCAAALDGGATRRRELRHERRRKARSKGQHRRARCGLGCAPSSLLRSSVGSGVRARGHLWGLLWRTKAAADRTHYTDKDKTPRVVWRRPQSHFNQIALCSQHSRPPRYSERRDP